MLREVGLANIDELLVTVMTATREDAERSDARSEEIVQCLDVDDDPANLDEEQAIALGNTLAAAFEQGVPPTDAVSELVTGCPALSQIAQAHEFFVPLLDSGE